MFINKTLMSVVGAMMLCSSLQSMEVDIHGFISAGYIKSSGDNDFLARGSKDGSFEFNEFGINFASDITDELRIGLQLFSRDLGDLGNNEVVVDWAFADYAVSDDLGFRFGRYKVAHGLHNESLDLNTTRTALVLPSIIYNSEMREVFGGTNGVQAYGNIETESFGDISWQFGVGGVSMDKEGGVAKILQKNMEIILSNKGIVTEDDKIFSTSTVNYMINANAIWETPLEGLSFALSGLTLRGFEREIRVKDALVNHDGNDSTPAIAMPLTITEKFDDYGIIVLSGIYQADSWSISGEYSWHGVGGKSYVTNSLEGNSRGDQSSNDWYIMADYELSEQFAIGTYFNRFEQYYDSSNPATYQNDTALTLCFKPVPDIVIKAEYHAFQGSGYNAQTLATQPSADKNWNAFLVKVSTSF